MYHVRLIEARELLQQPIFSCAAALRKKILRDSRNGSHARQTYPETNIDGTEEHLQGNGQSKILI
jgi:hypothetical protein